MKHLILLPLVLISLLSIGQNNIYYNSALIYSSLIFPPQAKPAKNAKKVEYTYTNKKGKQSTKIKEYNKKGRLLKQEKLSDNQELIPVREYGYNEMDKMTFSKSYKKGKLRSSGVFTYNSSGKLVTRKSKNAKGKETYGVKRTYNDNDCLTESISYRNGKATQRFVYEYYEKCEKKKTTLYNKKGKVTGVWSYECKTEGEKLEKKKNETQICVWTESDKNQLLKVSQTFNEKGEIRKTIKVYTRVDTLLLEIKKYDENSILISHWTYDSSSTKPLTKTHYKNGKKVSETISAYENGKLKTYKYYRKGKLYNSLDYEYDGDLMLAITRTYKSGKKGVKTSYKYDDNKLVEVLGSNLNGDLIYSSKINYLSFYASK